MQLLLERRNPEQQDSGSTAPDGPGRYPGGAASFPYLSPHTQAGPLDLCTSKAVSPEASQPAFSASKMLQNLAQSSCSSSPPVLSAKGAAQEPDARRPQQPRDSPSSSTTPLSDRPSSCGTPSLKEDSQIQNLLERRTVLQLLLGAASPHAGSRRAVDVPEGCCPRAGGAGGGTSVFCPSAHHNPPAVKVKTEEIQQPALLYQDSVPDGCPAAAKASRAADKTGRYGLLSQLLKQQSAAYYCSPLQAPGAGPGPGEGFHVPSPKRRRLCSGQADLFNHISPSQAEEGESQSTSSLSPQDEPLKQKEVKQEEEEEPPAPRALAAAPSVEGQGFNVLKQLLLSDNCLKELSQQSQDGAGPCASKAAGASRSYQQGLARLRGCPAHAQVSGPPGAEGQAAPGDGLRLQPEPQLRALVKREPGSADGWTSQEVEDRGRLDSPQLSRSNPILYYMLQKGSLHLRRTLRDAQAAPPRSIKEEAAGELLASPAPAHALQLQHGRQSRGLS